MISVIVPVYCVEQYLQKCIDSVLNQTYRDFEVILIDDGSPDECGKISGRGKTAWKREIGVYGGFLGTG